MDLSIIIVNWNTRALLVDCLNSIAQNVGDLDTEIIVVDNASTDGSADTVRREFPQVRLLENNSNPGFAGANNQGIALARGRYLLLLNSDTIVRPETLQRAIHFMDEHPEAGLCGVKLVHPDGSFQASYADFPTLKSEFFIATGLGTRFISPYYPSPRPQPGTGACEIDWVAGAFMLVRREVLAQVGDMDEAYYMYSEETDWCYRIKRAGWKIYYLPDVAITHIGGASTRQRSAEMVAQLNKSKIRFFAKHYGRWRAAQLRLALWLIFAVREGSIYCLLVVQPSANRNRWRAELREARLIRKVCLQPL